MTTPVLPSQTPSPFINNITVQNLVDHAGGWNDHRRVRAKDGTIIPGTNWDPMFNMREITAQLSLTGPATKRNIAEYMYGQPLQFQPGTQSSDTTRSASYSNFGYLLLGLVVEEVTGESFIDFVRSTFSEPGCPLDVHLSRTLGGSIHNREVWYDDPGMGLSPLKPHATIETPYPYGGEGWTTECADSNGGLMTTAATLARFISRHAVWGLGGRAAGSARTGSQAGTSSYAASLTNGVDCAFIFNTRSFPDGPNALNTFTAQFYSLVSQI
ncbi:MAG: beta-lactamase family protein [Acidobacteriaceae bacterium]|nr:beta-lactamase family protein [Acidobacteriaceae bacterium]